MLGRVQALEHMHGVLVILCFPTQTPIFPSRCFLPVFFSCFSVVTSLHPTNQKPKSDSNPLKTFLRTDRAICSADFMSISGCWSLFLLYWENDEERPGIIIVQYHTIGKLHAGSQSYTQSGTKRLKEQGLS